MRKDYTFKKWHFEVMSNVKYYALMILHKTVNSGRYFIAACSVRTLTRTENTFPYICDTWPDRQA